MLSSAEIIGAVAERIRHWHLARLVVDPVMVAKSGDRLLREDAVEALVRDLLPLAMVLTPNPRCCRVRRRTRMRRSARRRARSSGWARGRS
jgi:hydroxymethylpyrimidine/phosphomethylpyrimidine kinase